MADAGNDHDYLALHPPRALSAWEKKAIDRILTWPSTPTALRAAMRHVAVDAECRLCPSVSLRVPADQKPLVGREGGLVYAVAPGELQLGAGGARTHILLHLSEGVPIELGVYRDDGEPVAERPDIDTMTVTETP
ncbi:MAG: hypothetical protein M3451_08970 [Chloroflexota bacterium]|nr:hypothetical protein [Chloroflexota bacterium]